MGYAMTGRADGNGAEIGGVSPQIMDRFSSRAQAIDSRLRTWAGQYTARHGKPPSRRTIYLMGQEIAKDTRRSKAEARLMAGGTDTGQPPHTPVGLHPDALPVLAAFWPRNDGQCCRLLHTSE
jgi:TrwC relaxase